MPTKIYTILYSSADWERAISSDPAPWSYDQNGALPVEPEVFARLAQPSVWSPVDWDQPPKTYPARAMRYLNDPPEPEPEPAEEPAPRRKRGSKRKKPDRNITRSFRVPPETPEKIDYLCEAYRMSPGQVVSRLVDEAYRRDVVSSGLLAVLGDELGIVAPLP